MGWEAEITKDLTAPEKARNMIVLLDGTWNDENGRQNNGNVTNIYKLFTCMKGSGTTDSIPFLRKTAGQLAMYFRGVGNDEESSLKKTYYEGMFGAGEKNIRDNAYANMVKHYHSGDRIFIIGFSRGAACARLLARKLEKHGIPERIRIKTGLQKNYTTGLKETRFLEYKERGDSRPVDVEFLGLFDTVGAFGIPFNIGPFGLQQVNLFKNLDVAQSVRKTVHLVSIDESREPFIPTLVNQRDNVEEVWFPGVHADVGGGYQYCELGNLSLEFMVRRMQETAATGKAVQLNADELAKYTAVNLDQDAIHMHYHGDGLKKDPRKIQVLVNEKPNRNHKPKIHSSVRKLHEHADFHLVEELNSFRKLIPIKYHPEEIRRITDHYEEVD